MVQQNAFARSRNMMAQIHSWLHGASISALGEYKSRGPGGKHLPKWRFLGRFWQNASKYQPHTGAKQLAKAARRAAGEPLVSVPRRMWVMNNTFRAYWWDVKNSSRKQLAISSLSREYPIVLLPA